MNKKTKQYLVMLIAAVIATSIGTVLVYMQVNDLSRQEIPVDVVVGDYAGINLDSDAIHFGTVPPGSSAQRTMVLRAEKYDVEIYLIVEDNPYIAPEYKQFFLRKGESETIRLFATTEKKTPPGTYGGKLIIFTKKL